MADFFVSSVGQKHTHHRSFNWVSFRIVSDFVTDINRILVFRIAVKTYVCRRGNYLTFKDNNIIFGGENIVIVADARKNGGYVDKRIFAVFIENVYSAEFTLSQVENKAHVVAVDDTRFRHAVDFRKDIVIIFYKSFGDFIRSVVGLLYYFARFHGYGTFVYYKVRIIIGSADVVRHYYFVVSRDTELAVAVYRYPNFIIARVYGRNDFRHIGVKNFVIGMNES